MQSTFIPLNLQLSSWNDLKPYFEKLLNQNPTSIQDLEELIKNYSDVLRVHEEQNGRAYISMTCQTDSKEALARYEKFQDEINPQVSLYSNNVEEKIRENPYWKDLPAQRYHQYQKSVEKKLSLFRKENVPLYAELSKLGTEYSQTAGSLMVTIDGKEMTIPQAQSLLHSENRNQRYTVWKAVQDTRLQVKEKCDGIMNAMVSLRNKVALNAGYSNFRDYQHDCLHRFDYSPQDVLTLHAAIKKQVRPLAEKILAQRAKQLGVLEDFRPWDTEGEAPGTQALTPFSSSEEFLNKTIQVFEKVHPEFGQNLKVMKEEKLFDLETRKGKAPGGYNYPLAVTNKPFIFMNSAGTHRDLVTLMHEGGHAMHSFLTAAEPLIFYQNTPMEMAETASMSMELISSSHWNIFYNETDCLRARQEHLEDIVLTFPWFAVVDSFQHWLYLNPNHSVTERDLMFRNLMEEHNPSIINWKGYEKYLENIWQKQLHIFEVPFYYIEYAIAQLGALQVYRHFLKNPQNAIDKYRLGLSQGSTKSLPEIWKLMNIEFNFSASMLEDLMSFVEEELHQLEKKTA